MTTTSSASCSTRALSGGSTTAPARTEERRRRLEKEERLARDVVPELARVRGVVAPDAEDLRRPRPGTRRSSSRQSQRARPSRGRPSHGGASKRCARAAVEAREPVSRRRAKERDAHGRRTVAARTRGAQARYGSPAMRIRLAFSPDSDDIFMFWALLAGKIDAEGLVFEAERADTETLNARAAGAGDARRRRRVDRALPGDRRRLPALAPRDVRRPRLRAGRRRARARATSRRSRARASACPGCGRRRTSCCACSCRASSRSSSPSARTRARSRPCAPARSTPRCSFTRAASRTSARGSRASATSARRGRAATGGLPLPLGGNAIRRGLGPELVAQGVAPLPRVDRLGARPTATRRSQALLARESRSDLALDRALLDRYLAMYANADTLSPPDDVRRAIDELYARAHAAGLMPKAPPVEMA